MKNKFLLLLLVILLFPISIQAKAKVNLYLFYGDGCPHCKQEEEFLNKYMKDKDYIKLTKYEVWNNKDNQKFFTKVQKKLDNRSNGVPYLIIGNEVVVGYYEGITDEQIKDLVKKYKNVDVDDVVKKIINNEDVQKIIPTDEKVKEYKVPILGKIKSNEVSLPILAVVLGLVDGFNPCAMWVLIFLITMLINAKDRKKMWVLGLTFILTSGLVYLCFMMAWLNLATFISKLFFVRLLIAFVAFIVGFINLNNYYTARKKDSGCNVVSKKDRKKIMDRITKILSEKNFALAILGIIVLAASINVIEMMCSIGLPLIFTQILAMNNLSFGGYALYMFLYILFFLLDDIIIFIIAMTTFKVTGISTKYSKYSHLIAGIITILIGLLLLLKPSLLMFNF